MKRFFAILLSLCLALSLVPSMAEETAVPLPQAGDVVHGFEATEIREFGMIGAQVVRFVHQKTGAELYYIANDDTNRVFDLSFFTDAIDNTGLPHVFEHSTLDGSDKYPSKALWFNLAYQTYNTYMNAFTNSRYTSYPVASLSEAQLLKLADLYTDSCLHPMVMKDESIYREEAWRYRLPAEDAELTMEGTVYSEMQGAMTLNSMAQVNALRAAFPGSTIGNESGGLPESIPDMTWDMLKDYHNKYYHPSNCFGYLYGQFEDYTAFLQLLDEAFAPYERQEFTHTDDGYTPLTESVEIALPFPMEAGANTDHASMVFYYLVCPGLRDDAQQEMLLNTLTDLMLDDASNFQQSMRQALPHASAGCYIQTDSPDDAVVFYAMNVNADEAQTFKGIVDAALRDVADNGFAQDQVDSVMTRLNISSLLAREAADVGVETIIPQMAYSYSASGDPWDYINYVEALGEMDGWNAQGLYARAVSDWLLNNQTTALVTTYPEPGAKEQNDAALAAQLAEIKAAMSDEEIAALVAASNAEAEEEDTSEYIAQLKAVSVESLPEEIKLYDIADETDENGVRHVDAIAAVDGVGNPSLFLDASGLAQEDVHWFKLYTGLLGELDTEAHTRAELATLRGRYLYNGNIRVSLLKKGDDGFTPYLRLVWTALDDDLAAGYDLMYELLYTSKTDDVQRLTDVVQTLKANLRSAMNGNEVYYVPLYRAMAQLGGLYAYQNYVNYLDYYAFLESVERQLAEDPAAVTAKLDGIRDYFNNSANAVALFAGNEASIALNRTLSDAFLAKLDSREIAPVEYDFPIPAEREGIVLDINIQFNLLAASLEKLGLEDFDGTLGALTSLVNDMYLVPLLRDQYGVYTPWHGVFNNDAMYLLSYRDPNVAETFEVYDSLYDLVSALDVDQETLDGYILSSYSQLAMPSGELTGAVNAGINAMEGRDQSERLEWMRQLKAFTPETLKGYAELYKALSEVGVRSTTGAASAINANAELYDVILNPLGAQDNTQVQFADVTEEHPLYEAVRFAFENGYMAPRGEDSFGVDEPATNGDLLASMHALIGGSLDEEEALATFAGYGLMPAGIDLSAAMDPADCDALVSALLGDAVSITGGAESLTRGEYAAVLESFIESLG